MMLKLNCCLTVLEDKTVEMMAAFTTRSVAIGSIGSGKPCAKVGVLFVSSDIVCTPLKKVNFDFDDVDHPEPCLRLRWGCSIRYQDQNMSHMLRIQRLVPQSLIFNFQRNPLKLTLT